MTSISVMSLCPKLHNLDIKDIIYKLKHLEWHFPSVYLLNVDGSHTWTGGVQIHLCISYLISRR